MQPPGSRIWEHTIETVLFLELGAVAAVAVLPHAHLPGWSLPAIEVFAGLITAFIAWSLTGHAKLSFTALGVGVQIAALTVWAEVTGVWQTAVIATWIVTTFAAIPLVAFAAAEARDMQQEAAKPGPDPDADKRAEMAKFEYMFTELGIEGVTVADLIQENAGRVVKLNLPRTGRVTLQELQGIAHRIEVILQMREGLVEFTHGSHSGEITMRLREKDFMNRTVPLGPQYRATTINKPFAIGIQEDGSVASITLRELHAYIIGQTGAGKSNLINVLLAQLCGMVDTVVWVIDMKGGMVAQPWLRPFVDGRTDRPAIDWVATTREEAALMMHCFVKAIETRMNSGMFAGKIVPSASTPQIVLITDEMADLFGVMRGGRSEVGEGATTNQRFIRMGEDCTQKGRALAASSIWASQRGTNSMAGSGDMKANCRLRIMLGVAQEAEARYVQGDSRVAQKRAAAAVDSPGAGVITMGKNTSLMTKFFRHDHPPKPGTETDETLCDEGCVPSCPVYRSALETSGIRPQLDPLTARGLGEDYAQRWQRAGLLLRRPVPVPGGAAAGASQVDTRDFESIMHSGGVQDPEAAMKPWQKRSLAFLAARGAQGASPGIIMQALAREGIAPGARETLQRWLGEAAKQGLVHKADYGRWKAGAGRDSDAA